MLAQPCPSCHKRLVSVEIKVDGRVVSMHSCARCDRRWWVEDGVEVDPAAAFAPTPRPAPA